MKKNLKIVIINVLGVIFVLCLFEFFCFLFLICKYSSEFVDEMHSYYNIYTGYFKNIYFDPDNYAEEFRPPSIKNSTKGSVILFGCSYTYGDGLSDEESFSAQLSDYTNRSVYNRGYGGSGPQLMLFQLSSGNLSKEIPSADYIIYTIIDDHLNRIYKFRNWPFLTKISIKYITDKNDNLIMKQLKFPLGESSIMRLVDDYQGNTLSVKQKIEFLIHILDESYAKAKILYPNAKFVILEYSEESLFSKEDINRLKSKGFIVINLGDLTPIELYDEKYRNSKYDTHPNAKAWNIIVPALSKKLHL